MTDVDRISAATVRGRTMFGPAERERCPLHPTRWQIYRWVWPIDGTPEIGDAQVIRGCGSCAAEAE